MSFADQVYEILKRVPKGRVMTYKLLAEKLGGKAYQAVGQVLRRNPYAPEVPCHRVVDSDGSIGGFNGKINGKEIERKIELLRSEGVEVAKGNVVDFKSRLYWDSEEHVDNN